MYLYIISRPFHKYTADIDIDNPPKHVVSGPDSTHSEGGSRRQQSQAATGEHSDYAPRHLGGAGEQRRECGVSCVDIWAQW